VSEVVIPLSKSKIALLLFGAVAFVAACVWIWSFADREPDPLFVKGVAATGIVFFGLCAIVSCIKLLDGRPGLIIDGEGIVDNSSGGSARRILTGSPINISSNALRVSFDELVRLLEDARSRYAKS
jgi:hypothetical protein